MPSSKRIELTAVGDVMLGDSSHFLGRGVGTNLLRLHDASFPFAHVKDLILRSDIFFCNLESPLSSFSGRKPREKLYRGQVAAAKALKLSCVNVASLANNHSLQHGLSVFEETEQALVKAGVYHVGFPSIEYRQIKGVVITLNDLSICFYAISLVPYRANSPVDYANAMRCLLKSLESTMADVSIVSIHWGDEYVTVPSSKQREFAHQLIDNGVLVVLGHHPHVLQPVEEYHNGLIAYSLGNFIFDQFWSEETKIGGILQIALEPSRVISWNLFPTRLNDSFQPMLLDNSDASAVLEMAYQCAEITEMDYERLVAIQSRKHRRQMKMELLRHFGSVSIDTWLYFLSKRWSQVFHARI